MHRAGPVGAARAALQRTDRVRLRASWAVLARLARVWRSEQTIIEDEYGRPKVSTYVLVRYVSRHSHSG